MAQGGVVTRAATTEKPTILMQQLRHKQQQQQFWKRLIIIEACFVIYLESIVSMALGPVLVLGEFDLMAVEATTGQLVAAAALAAVVAAVVELVGLVVQMRGVVDLAVVQGAMMSLLVTRRPWSLETPIQQRAT
jgi:hypothetical protein